MPIQEEINGITLKNCIIFEEGNYFALRTEDFICVLCDSTIEPKTNKEFVKHIENTHIIK